MSSRRGGRQELVRTRYEEPPVPDEWWDELKWKTFDVPSRKDPFNWAQSTLADHYNGVWRDLRLKSIFGSFQPSERTALEDEIEKHKHHEIWLRKLTRRTYNRYLERHLY
jgi:hypothetical protein